MRSTRWCVKKRKRGKFKDKEKIKTNEQFNKKVGNLKEWKKKNINESVKYRCKLIFTRCSYIMALCQNMLSWVNMKYACCKVMSQ